MAVRFSVVEKVNNLLIETGEKSTIYGGVWDRKNKEYTKEKNIEKYVEYFVSKSQYDFIICDSPRTTGKGGRGGGKSEAIVFKGIKKALELSGENGQYISPTFDLSSVIWEKFISKMPYEWLHPKKGINIQHKTIQLNNFSTVRFRSGVNVRGLRSWGGSWCGLDEEADLTNNVIDVGWGCLRQSSSPQMFGAGTPQIGPYQMRYNKMLEDPDSSVFSFPSRDNPFISHRIFDIMRTQMDELRYRQEVLAEFVDLSEAAKVFYCFDRNKHCIKWPVIDIMKDITSEISAAKGCFAQGKLAKNIIGVDYNMDYPNYAVAYKVFSPGVWVAHKVIQLMGTANHLAKLLKEEGFRPDDTIIIDDASGDYNRGIKSSTRLMRHEGFSVYHHARNPHIGDRVNSTLIKLSPGNNKNPNWYCALPQCEELAVAMERLEWRANSIQFDKQPGHDHIIDAATYPIAYLDPIRRTQYIYQKAS